jgi:hypothetical protein
MQHVSSDALKACCKASGELTTLIGYWRQHVLSSFTCLGRMDQVYLYMICPVTLSMLQPQLNAGAHSAYLSRNTIAAKPELSRLDEHVPATLKQLRTGVWESDPGESPFSNSQAMRQQDMTSKQKSALASKALRFAQQHASAPVSAQATLGSLASMLMACSVLQAGPP